MSKNIFKKLLFIALITLILSISLSLLVNYNGYKKENEKNLANTMDLLEKSINYHSYNSNEILEYLTSISTVNEDLRISYFAESGKVLFDSKADASKLENHHNRPEFEGVTKYGRFDIKRFSNTMQQDTYYIATKLDSGHVLRVSINMNSIAGEFLQVINPLLFIAIVILVLAIVMSRYASQKILEPLDAYNGNIEELDTTKIPEIVPFVTKIIHQKSTITDQLNQIKKERDTIKTIIKNMKEGLIILDENKSVLMINHSAEKMLHLQGQFMDELEHGDFIEKKSIFHIIRKADLISGINECYEGNSSKISLEIQDKHIKIYMNPVKFAGDINGAVLLLVDETERTRLEKMRADFSANVSHELKTPLTSITGFAELLQNDMVKEEDRVEFISRIRSESDRLLDLIDDIMKISMLEESAEIKKEEVDLREISEKAMEKFKNKALDKDIAMSIQGQAKIHGNKVMMWELISNLMDNGIKYNVEHGSLGIVLSQEEGVSIQVSDTGIGIPEEDIPRVFERFYTVDKSRNKKRGGTGLGLSIVKHIVLSHNGRVEITSKEGEGTTIKVIF